MFQGKKILRRVPAVLSDIDGVLYRGKHAIDKSTDAVKCLVRTHSLPELSPKGDFGLLEDVKLPFSLLTNGGGQTEAERAGIVNRIMFGSEHGSECGLAIRESQMIECHTPLKKLVHEFADSPILVSGSGKIVEVCESYGFKKAIHVLELAALMPELCPLFLKS